MKAHTAVSLALSAVTLASCGGGQSVEISPKTQPVASRWNGVLATRPELAGIVQIHGEAWMAPDEKGQDRTLAHVEISNAVPGGVHPWHVHRGQCGTDLGVFGPADAYKPLKVEGNGRASSSATLPVAFPRSGDMFVNIHASAKNMSTIVACGNLAPPSR